MRRKRKGMAAILLAAAVGLSGIPTGSVMVLAETNQSTEMRLMETYGDYSYFVLEDATIEITG